MATIGVWFGRGLVVRFLAEDDATPRHIFPAPSRVIMPVHDGPSSGVHAMRNERTPQEILLAFFVAKFCTGTELPVVVRRAGFNTVTDLIDAFFARLGNLSPYIAVSRTSRQFRNSVLGLRNGDFKQPSKPLNQFLGKYQPIVSRCQTRTVEELWAELAEYREEARSAEHTGRDAPLGASGVAPSAPSGGTPEASEVQGGSGESYAYDDADLREAVLRQIRERRGQPAFRSG